MEKIKCCICDNELEAIKSYCSVNHIDDELMYLYEGHKTCLLSLKSKLDNGEEVPHIKVNKKDFL